jgi:hypothetical protein
MLARHHHPNVYTEKVSPRGVQHVVSRKPNPQRQTVSLQCAGSPLDQRSLTWVVRNILIEPCLSGHPQRCDHGYSQWSP